MLFVIVALYLLTACDVLCRNYPGVKY